MLGLEGGQVNESVEVGCVPKAQLVKNHSLTDGQNVKSRDSVNYHGRQLFRPGHFGTSTGLSLGLFAVNAN
jgi:hypothetical protein